MMTMFCWSSKKENRKAPGTRSAGSGRLAGVGALCVLFIGLFCGAYVGDYYRADETAQNSMQSGSGVDVVRIKTGWLFDGPGEDAALVFYPGAKVAEEAYAPLLHRLAEEGVDCFLVKMPGRLAIFGQNRAESVMKEYSYNEWYLAGHSLGGAMAAGYASKHIDRFAGLILLAAYPTGSLEKDEFKVLSVYGSEDLVLNREKLEDGKKYMPKNCTELCIEGGNHAQFGSYGKQKGDGEAALSPQEQQAGTVEAILSFIKAGS